MACQGELDCLMDKKMSIIGRLCELSDKGKGGARLLLDTVNADPDRGNEGLAQGLPLVRAL